MLRRSPIKSATRVLEVLSLFTTVRAPLRQKYVVQQLGYPQSSMTALLKSLVALGYLNYDRASRTYFPTTRVAALGDWINHSMYGDGQLLEMMRTLQARTEETVTLVTQNDLFIQYVRVVEPPHEHKFPPSEGAMRVLTQSSGGLVLLSRMTDAAVDKLVRHIRYYEQDRGQNTDMPQLLAHLTWIRREGYCFLAGTPIPGASAVAMPLPGGPHSIPLAIGVGGTNARIARHKTRIVAAMRDEIAAYEQAMSAARARVRVDVASSVETGDVG